jgi:hypothetical protein
VLLGTFVCKLLDSGSSTLVKFICEITNNRDKQQNITAPTWQIRAT